MSTVSTMRSYKLGQVILDIFIAAYNPTMDIWNQHVRPSPYMLQIAFNLQTFTPNSYSGDPGNYFLKNFPKIAIPESDADKFSDASDALQINEEIAEIRKVKFPEFWKSRPALWFAQIEAQFLVHNIRSDQTKFNKLVCELDYSILEQVADIIESPPEKDRYNTIKTRLIKQFTESEGKRLRKLLNDVELGDQRSSGLLRKMKLLAGDKVGSELLQSIWMQRLPENIRAILASMDSTDNDKLAEIADKILDAREPQIEFVHRNLSSATHVFLRDDRVRTSLSPPYSGPHPVIERITNRLFRIEVNGKNFNVSTERLKPAFFLNDENKTHQDLKRTYLYSRPPPKHTYPPAKSHRDGKVTRGRVI
ncbi:uncharacterized protein LOC119654163 [Hermetia illucens]|uniref:uncharacterized protein LOC119654163 n=1 Tax=Hermetia illucens TaxID=343691 RepID=UPI0018CC134F|nr:uncharacterized protein LOC119654163 [Hermetia illucens]